MVGGDLRRLRTLGSPVADEPVLIDVNESLTRVLEAKSYSFHVGNVHLDVRLAANLPKVLCQAGQIESVFLNIMDNAQQAMLEVHAEGVLKVGTSLLGENVQVSIADDGPGIPAENLADVFTPFFTTKGTAGGMGLGLSISRDTIRRHGGEVRLESRVGAGVTAYVELPGAAASDPGGQNEAD